jgi:YidC/Oxa1 family membrane protein insertase
LEQNQEDFDQKRFLLAMVLSGLVLVVWQVFFAPEPPPPQEPEEVTKQATETAETAGEPAEEVAEPSVDLEAEPEPVPEVDLPVVEHQIRTEYFRVKFSSRGARVVEAEILKPEQYSEQLLAEFPKETTHFPFALDFTKDNIALRRDLVWQFVEGASEKKGEDFAKVTYRHTDPGGRFIIDKIFQVDKEKPYQLDLKIKLTNRLKKGTIADHLALDMFGYKDPEKESSFLDVRPDEVESICRTQEDLEREMISSVDSPLTFDESPTRWGAIDTRYFLFAATPDEQGEECAMQVVDDGFLRTRIIQPEFSIRPGETYDVGYDVFIGPKDYDVLEATQAGLEEAVDYGILTFLARPLRWALVNLYGFVGNWGLAIIILTLIIRLLTWPINKKVYENAEKMKELQPRLKEIQEKYKDDQQRLAEETMKVWKEGGASPLGCAPMLLQFPILLALYYMILNSVEMYRANFALWYTDLSAPDPYFVLPILMGAVMFVQQKFMTPTTDASGPNAQMQTVMKIMPIMFTVFMLFLPSGVVLYYSVSLVLGLVQQFWIKRSFRAKSAAAA